MYPEVYGLSGEKQDFGLIPETHPRGLQIERLIRGFPADVAGLKPGDVLISLNGTSLAVPIADYYFKVLPSAAFGSKSIVRFLRAGSEYEAEVIVGIPPNFAALAKTTSGPRPVSGAPSLKLGKLTVNPPVLSPGQRFALQIDYSAAGIAPGPEGSDVQLGFSILEAGNVLHTERPVSLGPPNGAVQTRLQHLNAARKPGTYTIRVSLRCRDLSAEDSVDFTIR
jgi:hypothetical protein